MSISESKSKGNGRGAKRAGRRLVWYIPKTMCGVLFDRDGTSVICLKKGKYDILLTGFVDGRVVKTCVCGSHKGLESEARYMSTSSQPICHPISSHLISLLAPCSLLLAPCSLPLAPCPLAAPACANFCFCSAFGENEGKRRQRAHFD